MQIVPRKDKNESESLRKKWEVPLRQLGWGSSRRGAGSSGSLQLTGERKRASRGLERGREGWAMARQKPWGSPTVFYIINVSLRVLYNCIADWTMDSYGVRCLYFAIKLKRQNNEASLRQSTFSFYGSRRNVTSQGGRLFWAMIAELSGSGPLSVWEFNE